ncbi:hypothetical protein UFOVP449_206 [uncultured Caudovirales phage]|uniref:Uncharacterized protein n=1 Tax=uncultured Caudovirales phage TaxID=2100421 RepID=A0A6J5MA23_9CAUD|nr:hypothetical protein UFOVP449_206 [uncultured Caudovirales phage]
MLKLVDKTDSKSVGITPVTVRVRPGALNKLKMKKLYFLLIAVSVLSVSCNNGSTNNTPTGVDTLMIDSMMIEHAPITAKDTLKN